MNLTRANEIRASLGLSPLTGDPQKQAKAKRAAANKAARAQESRDLKAKRGSRSK